MMIASSVLAIIAGGIFILLNQSQSSFTSQQDLMEVVQQARIAMDQITAYLRPAGNDPEEIFASETPPFGHTHSGLFPIEISGAGHIQINADVTGSITSGAVIDQRGDPDGTLSQRYEKVVIRYDSSADKLYINIGDGEELLAQNISTFSFTYYDLAGAQISNPASNEGDIVQVHVQLVAETADPDPDTGKLQTLTLESDVMLRNKAFSLAE
ncbi:hypothetical protein MYX82_10855 [Acidobacteria bacterium AH-259-D05]|nr:hypothetical protein [Acidobacteria bacterium AH-259-D05]